MEKYEILLRLGLSIFVGGLIGYEREHHNKPAGFITHILVCMGATIIAILQDLMVKDSITLALTSPQLGSILKVDNGRLIAQVVSGVGFLGAGAIMHNKGSVVGLTTAATLWVVACIGLAAGMGYYFLAVIAGASVYGVLVVLRQVKFRIHNIKSNQRKRNGDPEVKTENLSL